MAGTSVAHSPAPKITRAHKAAIILAALGPEAAREIVGEIGDAQLKAFAKAFADLQSVPPQLLHSVAREFLLEVERIGSEIAGGAAEARRLLVALAGEERAARMLADGKNSDPSAVLARLEAIESGAVAAYLAKQRPAVAAIVLSRLSAEKTASILDAGEAAFAQAALIELSKKRDASDEAVAAIAAGIEADFLAPRAGTPSPGAAAGLVTEIVNCLPALKRDALLGYLERQDVETAQAVRKALIVFEDLHRRLPEAAVPILIRNVNNETLLKAVKHGRVNAPDTVKFLFGAISKRMVEQYEEAIGAMPEITPDEGEAAQRSMLSSLRKLAAAGAVKLLPPPAEA